MTAVRRVLLLLLGGAAAGLLLGALVGVTTSILWVAPLALAVGFGLMYSTWRDPVVGAVVVVAFVPALSGLSRGLVVPAFKVSEVLLMVCVAGLLLSRPRRWRAVNGVDLALLLFAVAALCFAVYHASDGSSDLESVLRIGLQPTFLLMTWWVASRGVERPHDLAVVLRWMLLVSLVPGALSVLQFFDVAGLDQILIQLTSDGVLDEGSRAESTRVTGPFPIWHSVGGYLLVPVVLAATLLLRGDRSVLRRRWLMLVLLVDLAALVLAVTVTILVWLPVAFLVAAALAGQLRRGSVLLLAMAAAAVLAFPSVLQERVEEQSTQTSYTAGGVLPQTVEYRILVWQRDYLPLLDEAAVAGLGNDPPADVVFTSTENQYITYALRGGLGLVAAAVLVMGALAVRSWRHARIPESARPDEDDPSPARSGAMVVFGIVLFLPAALMVWPYLTNAGLSQTLFAFAGAVLALEPRRLTRFAALLAQERREAAEPGRPSQLLQG